MQFYLWIALAIFTGLCLTGLMITLRGALWKSKLRRRKANVRKWVQSQTAVPCETRMRVDQPRRP